VPTAPSAVRKCAARRSDGPSRGCRATPAGRRRCDGGGGTPLSASRASRHCNVAVRAPVRARGYGAGRRVRCRCVAERATAMKARVWHARAWDYSDHFAWRSTLSPAIQSFRRIDCGHGLQQYNVCFILFRLIHELINRLIHLPFEPLELIKLMAGTAIFPRTHQDCVVAPYSSALATVRGRGFQYEVKGVMEHDRRHLPWQWDAQMSWGGARCTSPWWEHVLGKGGGGGGATRWCRVCVRARICSSVLCTNADAIVVVSEGGTCSRLVHLRQKM